MTAQQNESTLFDRQLGVATTRIEELDRRVKAMEDKSDNIKEDLRDLDKRLTDIDARLKKLEESTKEIAKSVGDLVKQTSKFDGFLAGVKISTNFWYVVGFVVFSFAGYIISKVLPLL